MCKRELVEHTIAHAIGQGLDSLMECCKVFERADHRQGDGGHLIPPNLQGGWLAIYGETFPKQIDLGPEFKEST